MVHRPAPKVVPKGHVVVPGLGITVPRKSTQTVQKPARIQPRRSGARVSTDASTCVQAALHTRGRCACGWEG